jgi:hypothetical protein
MGGALCGPIVRISPVAGVLVARPARSWRDDGLPVAGWP